MKRQHEDSHEDTSSKKLRTEPELAEVLKDLESQGYSFGRPVLTKEEITLLQECFKTWKTGIKEDSKQIISGGFKQSMIYDEAHKPTKRTEFPLNEKIWNFFENFLVKLGIPDQHLIELAFLEGPAGTVGKKLLEEMKEKRQEAEEEKKKEKEQGKERKENK